MSRGAREEHTLGPIWQDTTRPDLSRGAWERRPGFIGWLGQCNHKAVGRRFIATAFGFLVIGGVLALLMRTQLAVSEADVLGADAYNRIFTMHGTTMMFLYAVPILVGFSIYFAPLMLGARDMPMPRLNAFSYWAYLFGGMFLYSSFLVGQAPQGGWFAYVPFTRTEFTPDLGMDFWLLGVTFVEISAIVGAIEIITLCARSRAPGMSLTRMPVFVWSSLVTSLMIIFAFPPLVVGSVMLELDRKLNMTFFDPWAGGDPLLWQHLFWFFGHPEVYIQLLPALGILAAVLTVGARRPIAARTLVIASIVAIAILSFGLWVHHMFAVGIPLLAMSFFTAASFMITIPSGVIVLSYIATVWRGRWRWTTPMLFLYGFIFIFVLGGITGVMVAIVPFNWQVHDTFFIVAHMHYVLIGGNVFPVFAGLHHWLPKITGRMLSETAGRWTFWLMFIGFNVSFFPQHILGLDGMPRRTFTYLPGMGWDLWNLVSTVGAFVLAAGVAVFIGNFVWSLRRGPIAPPDPWGGATLEWATDSPTPNYNFQTKPTVRSPEPLWDPHDMYDPYVDDERWRERLADPSASLQRQELLTTGLDARPEQIVTLPGFSIWPITSAAMIAVLLLGVLIDSIALAVIGLVGLIAVLIAWSWPGYETVDPSRVPDDHAGPRTGDDERARLPATTGGPPAGTGPPPATDDRAEPERQGTPVGREGGS